jgi:hypothetical protein
MKASLALVSVLILATPAAAAPQLLLELHWEQAINSRVPDRAQLGINARLPFTDPVFQAYLSDWRTPQDVGQTFSAMPGHADKFQTVFSHPTGHWWIAAAHEYFTSSPDYTVDNIWNMPRLANVERPTDVTAITHVPRRGFGLNGYMLTDVTQTVDRFVATRLYPGGVPCQLCWAVDQAQTIRFYGEAIPEPTSILLLAHVLVCCAARGSHCLARRLINQRD